MSSALRALLLRGHVGVGRGALSAIWILVRSARSLDYLTPSPLLGASGIGHEPVGNGSGCK